MADSYNQLVGLGSHLGDSALEGLWDMQDDAATTTVVDSSSGGSNGTLVGGDNSDDLSGTGPNSWLAKALDYSLGSSYTNLPITPSYSADEASMLAWFKANSNSVAAGAYAINEFTVGGSKRSFQPFSDGNVYSGAFRTNGSAAINRVTVGSVGSMTSWRKICIKSENAASGWVFRADGTTEATATGDTLLSSSQTHRIGHNGSEYFNGLIAGVAIFSRKLTDAEEANYFDGPEPLNTVAPAITGTEQQSDTLTCSTGSWDSQSNGTITYSYQWTRSNDGAGSGEVNISGATSSTYVPVAGDVGKFLRCLVRGSNDGGFDSAEDTYSGFTGAIASSGGGGGTTENSWYYSQQAAAVL